MSEYKFQQVFYRAITPLHVGCGQDVGVVDLPIFRERTTGYPMIPGSGIRGTLRDRFEVKDDAEAKALTRRLFGSDQQNEISAGCISVLDARILLFPVRSVPKVFVWITCPFVIGRYSDDTSHFLGQKPALDEIKAPPDEDHYLGVMNGPSPLWLEEFPFHRNDLAWSWKGGLDGIDAGRVVLVADSVFDYFVRHATIITQHNRLTSAKTVEGGMLFSVEAVPPEAVFYAFIGCTSERTASETRMSREEALKSLRKKLTGEEKGTETYLSLGGDESTGLGVTRMAWVG
ncbi:MAG: type III-B CRISPR module RAMP protein Cmr4 [Acidobacteria bacterium]|nr:type III-B CRISPR module RAMP protein Cmr4 [Acidobacteriota bacterium]